jgi:hypothetical protein
MIGIELEVMAKKFDRFGWERDRGSAAHDRLIMDWMDALHDYPLDEVKAACRAVILSDPGRMPNEGHVVAAIMDARRKAVALLPRYVPEPEPPRCSPEDAEIRKAAAEKIMADFAARHRV